MGNIERSLLIVRAMNDLGQKNSCMLNDAFWNLSEPKGPTSSCRAEEERCLSSLVTFSEADGGLLGGTEAVVV